MARWRELEGYTPFARLLVDYMWQQRPPLLPSQFASQMGVRKQQVSLWLNSETIPSPALVVQLARGMSLSVRDLLIAAGHATEQDPLFDRTDAWGYVLGELGKLEADESNIELSLAFARLREVATVAQGDIRPQSD